MIKMKAVAEAEVSMDVLFADTTKQTLTLRVFQESTDNIVVNVCGIWFTKQNLLEMLESMDAIAEANCVITKQI